MALPQRFLDELLDRCDIVELVSKYVRLKRTGSNHMGLCPFHNEKTPSFSVSADKQFFHCFGCGEGGNALSFLMKIENLGFIDAVRQLADLCGMEVPEDEGESKAIKQRRERLLALNRDAARYFHTLLYSPRGEAGLTYFKNRGLGKKTITAFGLGYAGPEWDGLCQAMRALGYTPQELIDAWLIKPNRSGGYYDIFRDRVIFPIINVRGEVIAFGGRVLSGDGVKYLNSSDTLVFRKSNNLFALNLARKNRSGQLILAEGYMDVIALHQAGFDGAVASLGTALTSDQARLISRYAGQVVICYDSDQAGQKAAQRAIDILNRAGLEVRVLKLPGAKDPDDYIKNNGRDAFSDLLNRPVSDVDYQLGNIAARFDLELDEDRVKYLREAVRFLATLPGEAQREVFAGRVAANAKVSFDAVMSEVKRTVAINRKRQLNDLKKKAANPTGMRQPKERELRYQNMTSSVSEEKLIGLLLNFPELVEKTAEKITPDEFSSPFLAKIYANMLKRREEGLEISAAGSMAELEDAEVRRLALILSGSVPSKQPEEEMEDYCDVIRFEYEKKTGSGDDILHRAVDRRRQG